MELGGAELVQLKLNLKRQILESLASGISHHTDIALKNSKIPNCGLGVFSNEVIRRNEFVTLYPGSIYYPGDSIFFQSIRNQFVFRCHDGIFIDGNNKGMSRMIFKSLTGRIGPKSRDTTWLSLKSTFSVGQIINNGGSNKFNVAYQELDFNESELSTAFLRVRKRLCCPCNQFG